MKAKKAGPSQVSVKPSVPPMWRGWLAGGSTGLLHALAYPNAGIGWLAMLAYMPMMLWLWKDRPSLRRAMLSGLFAGTVLHAVGHYWIAFTLRKMTGMPAAAAWAIVLVYSLGMGLHQAAWAWCCAVIRTEKIRPLPWALATAALWTAVEFAIPFQFPWFLGNALFETPVWMQAADIVGIWGVTLLCVSLSACAFAFLASVGRRERLTALAALTVVASLWYGYGAWRLATIDAVKATSSLKVALIQPNPTIAEKTSLKPMPRIPLQDRAERLTRAVLKQSKEASAAEIDLVVWPEGSLPFYYVHKDVAPLAPVGVRTRAPPVVKHATHRAHLFAKSLNKPLLLGALRRDDALWKTKAHNSAMLLDREYPRAIYDKKKLVPFGEYLPGTGLVPGLADAIPGVSDLAPGRAPSLMNIAGRQIGVNICYEALFAGFMLDNVGDAEIMINLTDDLWFGPTNAPNLHLMVQYPRAIELRRPLLRATATGVSTHIDAAGRIHGRTAIWEEATLVVDVEVKPLSSPFRNVGLWPMRGLTVICAVFVTLAWRRRRLALAQATC